MFAALLPRGLDDFPLIVRRIDIESIADGIQRNHGQSRTIFGEPGILARPRKTGHERYRAAKVFMRHIVQTAQFVAIEQEPSVVIGESEWADEARSLLRNQLPKVKFLLGPARFFRVTTARVRERKEIEQTIVHKPRERNDLVFGLFLLQ